MKLFKNKSFFLSILWGFIFVFTSYAQNIKVACVGNSVTYGAKIKNREINAYPAQLQQLLGSAYEVVNFGHSGATALKNGHKPYWIKPEFEASKKFQPNIVIIHLGLNDQGMNNWPHHKDEFEDDYIDLIKTYKALPTKPKVIICKMSPTFSGHRWFEEGMRESFKEIQTKIEKIAQQENVQLINLHDPLYRFPELFPDQIHPQKKGATIIANKVFSAITGDFGGLKLAPLFGEKMVLQRNEPITISGISNANDVLKIVFNKKKITVKVSSNGQWNVTFPAMKAGGPHKLEVISKQSENISIKEVYIGEVWLASGQSNMGFKVKSMKHAKTVLQDSVNQNIFLYAMDGIKSQLSGHRFSKEQIENCNATDFFTHSGWSNNNKKILENFSAVAYAYAYNLQKELQIPVGIICNAIGGSPIQSWISRESMEARHETIDLLNDTHLNPMVQTWVGKRKSENFTDLKDHDIFARHHFDPTFLFDAGIYPIKNYNIKGVIWYQGESNAERVSFHSMLFKMLVRDWRTHWKKPDMPFYYVQLSSINRPTWGHFRDSQRRLLFIPNTGMAVSSDVGHPTNVHPKQKWVVGERLSKVALANVYDKNIPFSGPLLDYVNVKGQILEAHFKYGKGLKTVNNEPLVDIQIAGADKNFVKAEAKIKDDILIVWSDKIKNPRFVKYGYSPYTNANLVNKYGLPASTFSNLNTSGL